MPLPPGVSSGGGAGGVRGAAAALPPFLFLHMPRDAFTARGVESGVAALLARGPGGGAPAARALELLPRRVDGSTLHGAMPWLVSPGLSAAVFTALLRTPGALTHDAAAGRGGAPARDPPLGDPAGGMWVAADPRGDAVRRAVLSVVDAHGGRLTTRAGDDGHPVFDVSPERQDRQPSLILPPGSGGGGVVPPPLEPARDAATIAARAAVLAAAEGVRILQRNVLEVLNERYAEHEMSAQHAEVVAETLAGWAEAARGRGG